MATATEIDTSSLLTILGLIAAVWALISPTSKLRFRFCIAWFDWLIASAVFLIVHYLVFETTLKSVGLYYSLGPWRWGFDTSSAIYLLLLATAIYFFWRTNSPKLVRGKIHIFRELTENLRLTKRYDELVLLVEPQLSKLIGIARLRGVDERSIWQQLKFFCSSQKNASTEAREILLNLITSPELTVHMAAAHPYFSLKLFEADNLVHSDFIEHYIEALLDVPGSRLYVELKNNQNLNGGSRLYLLENNRLLRFFFVNASAAIDNGLDRAIGETVYRRLDEDNKLAEALNKPMGAYREVGKFRCPINSGITLFEIMVHEGIHQGLQDHMWLHYFRHFASKILEKMTPSPDEDNFQEWPTPFHYLLYRLVSVTTDWCKQCEHIVDAEIPDATRSDARFDRHFISKAATEALGDILEYVVSNEKISDHFKKYLLDIVLRSYTRAKNNTDLSDVTSSLITNIIHGSDLPRSSQYHIKLQKLFEQSDHILRLNAEPFGEALIDALSQIKK
ncbi:MAG: hypothetical protein B0W54_16910 [Cellvibrio sp. 79]|nr:MAG: hypothetical protein B0W54_16910 [Cellvibrio sp. 79]